MPKLTHGEAIGWAYQRVGQKTGKSQAYLFLLWTAMPVLSLLLILSRFPKERCGASQMKGCWLPLSLPPLEVEMVAVVEGMQQQSQIPSSTYAGMQLGANSAPWMRCSFLWLEVASEVDRRGQLRHPAAAQPAPGRVLLHSCRGLVPCHAVSCSTERTTTHHPSAGAGHWPYRSCAQRAFKLL